MRLSYVGALSTNPLVRIGDANIDFAAIPFAPGPPIGDIATKCPFLPMPLGERLRNRAPRKSRSPVGRPSLAFSQMTPAIRPDPDAAGFLGDVRSLVAQIGRSDGDDAAPLPVASSRVDTVPALRAFLTAYRQDVFVSKEWPVIVRAHSLASAGQARELIALDREWSIQARRQEFSEASFRVGQRQLGKLRPFKDQRVVQRYLAAIEAGEAHGWHPLAYGVVLAVFNLPLRQGLVNYAVQTLGGFVDAAVHSHRLPERGCAAVLDEVCAALPSGLPPLPDSALFAAA